MGKDLTSCTYCQRRKVCSDAIHCETCAGFLKAARPVNPYNGCGCGQLGNDCPGARCQHHRDNATGNAQEKAALGLGVLKRPERIDFQGAALGDVGQVLVPDMMLLELREMRAWHYQQMVRRRDCARQAVSARYALAENALADQHLRYVQTLNDFFPPTDSEPA